MKKIVCLSVLLALMGCADGEDKKEPPKAPPSEVEIRTDRLICPQVAILREAEIFSDYGGEVEDSSRLVAQARLQRIEGDCAYRTDKDDPTGIDISFRLKASAIKGPRLGGDRASFPYFIAVIDPSGKVLSRQVVTAQFYFSGNEPSEIEEPLHVFIPVPVGEMNAGPDHRVLVGFLKK
ncbi:MAG: hypothetical protein PHW76_01170 [Alphaproteobacteria bacterium]|nr:hypothetical protein [Alphaproteobacteria bacterium]